MYVGDYCQWCKDVLLNRQMGMSHKFMLVHPSIRPSVCQYFCDQFLRIFALVFSEILCSDRNLQVKKKKKSGRSGFFHKIILLLFLGSNLKWKALHYWKTSLFPCASPLSGKILIHKLQAKILSPHQFAGFSLGVMHTCPRILAWRHSPKEHSIWNRYFWSGVSRHMQPRPNLPRSAKESFGASWWYHQIGTNLEWKIN